MASDSGQEVGGKKLNWRFPCSKFHMLLLKFTSRHSSYIELEKK